MSYVRGLAIMFGISLVATGHGEKEVVVVDGHPEGQEEENYFSNILKFKRNGILLCQELLTEY